MNGEELKYIRDLAARQAGIDLEPDKHYLIEARLGSLARKQGFASISALVSRLKEATSSPLHSQVVEALTTQETSFFRDVHPFDALRQAIIPELMARRSREGGTRRLDIWCGAASTGQEPFSLAMLLREHFPQITGWQVRIIATDLSDAALLRANEGRFNQVEVTRGLDPALRKRYFKEDTAGWRIRDEIRQMIEFRKLNLLHPWSELPKMDLILMRNVLIYFSVPVKKEMLRRLHGQLRPDGCLLLGAAETTLHLHDAFDVVHLERTAYYRPAKPAQQHKTSLSGSRKG